jgi:2-oxoglutarate ferredoxin oxidoreductase subunit alpha
MSIMSHIIKENRAIVRFAGDSGDGMQLLGSEWVKSCALSHNDLTTIPDFPAEIRAPAGSLAGVSGFQIHFGSETIYTAGDYADVLVALNPAALKAHMGDLKKSGIIILNSGSFNDVALLKAGLKSNPLEDGSLDNYRVINIDMNNILRHALKDCGLSTRDMQKCKNFFCLGLLLWLYARDLAKHLDFIEEKFKRQEALKNANSIALRSGYAYGENTELMPQKQILKAPLASGTYRALTGNKALALGLITASTKAHKALFYASYPITPASDILHELAALRAFDVHTFQAEDEMAAISAAIGASYAGSIGVTATSGPGFCLKAEALGYAAMLELPLIVIDVQRAGPSTGMPTKTEQADLMQAIYGRHGDASLPVLAAQSPEHCFSVALDAMRIAIKYMTPVIILSDAAIASSSAPWRVVDPDSLENIVAHHEPYSLPFKPYERNADHARAWIKPGSVGLIHQLGGLEKDSVSGKVSYSGANHQEISRTRKEKIEAIKKYLPAPEIFGAPHGDVVLVGFGSTFGPLHQVCVDLLQQNKKVAHLHLSLVNPLHDEIGYILSKFKHIIICEHNQGQLVKLIRAQFLINALSLNKIMGKPFLVEEIKKYLEDYL